MEKQIICFQSVTSVVTVDPSIQGLYSLKRGGGGGVADFNEMPTRHKHTIRITRVQTPRSDQLIISMVSIGPVGKLA